MSIDTFYATGALERLQKKPQESKKVLEESKKARGRPKKQTTETKE